MGVSAETQKIIDEAHGKSVAALNSMYRVANQIDRNKHYDGANRFVDLDFTE